MRLYLLIHHGNDLKCSAKLCVDIRTIGENIGHLIKPTAQLRIITHYDDTLLACVGEHCKKVRAHKLISQLPRIYHDDVSVVFRTCRHTNPVMLATLYQHKVVCVYMIGFLCSNVKLSLCNVHQLTAEMLMAYPGHRIFVIACVFYNCHNITS